MKTLLTMAAIALSPAALHAEEPAMGSLGAQPLFSGNALADDVLGNRTLEAGRRRPENISDTAVADPGQAGGAATILQDGTGNAAMIRQEGTGHQAIIRQAGSRNTATVIQSR